MRLEGDHYSEKDTVKREMEIQYVGNRVSGKWNFSARTALQPITFWYLP